MKLRREQRLRSWMFIYAGLIAAIAFTDEAPKPLAADVASVSPVAAEAEIPTVELDAIARRSDI